jgi:phage gp36-like protein
MALLIIADFRTHIYPEITEVITRSDDTILTIAIANAESEAKSYLNRFDITAMFVTGNPDQWLKSLVKDLACWHLIKLANPNINLEIFRTSYEDAKKYFKDVMLGNVEPQGWPLRVDDAVTTFDESGHISSSSNTKRNNYF